VWLFPYCIPTVVFYFLYRFPTFVLLLFFFYATHSYVTVFCKYVSVFFIFPLSRGKEIKSRSDKETTAINSSVDEKLPSEINIYRKARQANNLHLHPVPLVPLLVTAFIFK
jgi:hypothetical protein